MQIRSDILHNFVDFDMHTLHISIPELMLMNSSEGNI